MSRLTDAAMISADGVTFMPDTVESARYFAQLYGARPAAPDRFPWRCAAARHYYEDDHSQRVAHVQCLLVDGHDGEHRGEVAW